MHVVGQNCCLLPMWKLEEAGQTPGLATCRLAGGSRASHFQVGTAAPSVNLPLGSLKRMWAGIGFKMPGSHQSLGPIKKASLILMGSSSACHNRAPGAQK